MEQFSDQYFSDIRLGCEFNDLNSYKGPDPYELAQHRSNTWPEPTGLPESLAKIYSSVKQSGLPNALGVRLDLDSNLNLDEWDKVFSYDKKHREMLDFVRYGFPMGYLGPTSHYDEQVNHTSADNYSDHIDKFVSKEIDLGGIIGPTNGKPFSPWMHTAPMMSRPKRDSNARRVIADLIFPQDRSVNAYILKNTVWGESGAHSLPTVTAFVEEVKDMGRHAYMSIIDISRAYKNFRSDPLDWPLLCAYWDGRYYCDVTLPFGSRASSYHMQSVANAITEVLGREGIVARMYLDDLITLSPDKETAIMHHNQVLQLLEKLGLPVAIEKIQPPSRAVEWLGININTDDMTLSIPRAKIEETLQVVSKYRKRRSMSNKDLQSVVGRLVHIAKCVQPARLFISRLLEALRDAPKRYVKVSSEMKQDFDWFTCFCRGWNGVALHTFTLI